MKFALRGWDYDKYKRHGGNYVTRNSPRLLWVAFVIITTLQNRWPSLLSYDSTKTNCSMPSCSFGGDFETAVMPAEVHFRRTTTAASSVWLIVDRICYTRFFKKLFGKFRKDVPAAISNVASLRLDSFEFSSSTPHVAQWFRICATP